MNVKGVDYTKLYEIIVLFKYSSITVFVVIEFVINSRLNSTYRRDRNNCAVRSFNRLLYVLQTLQHYFKPS